MSTSVGILPMILRWGCGVPVAATSRESYALAMSIGRNTGPVGSGKGVKVLALTGGRAALNAVLVEAKRSFGGSQVSCFGEQSWPLW